MRIKQHKTTNQSTQRYGVRKLQPPQTCEEADDGAAGSSEAHHPLHPVGALLARDARQDEEVGAARGCHCPQHAVLDREEVHRRRAICPFLHQRQGEVQQVGATQGGASPLAEAYLQGHLRPHLRRDGG